jgi:hypothetical protein
LVQGGVNRVLELGDGDVKKFRADLRREAHQNSKYKAVPRERLQHKEAAQFRGKEIERVRCRRDFVRRRIVDLTASIRRPRCDRSSHASIPSITAVSAVFVLPARSKAVRKAISTALEIESIAITTNPAGNF